jgi:uncharacterized repeat protein (TIGR01451 family)
MRRDRGGKSRHWLWFALAVLSLAWSAGPLVAGPVPAPRAAGDTGAARLGVALGTARSSAAPGDLVTYTVTVTNRSQEAFSAAAGTPVSLLLMLPRGFTYLPGSAVARLQQEEAELVLRPGQTGPSGRPFTEEREDRRSGRLVRLGPFDLMAGQTITITYVAAIGLDTRPGQHDARALALAPGDVALSSTASAAVRVVPGELERSPIFGRVFCDADRDGRFDPGERGVHGARVALESGVSSQSDGDGRFHFSAVAPGTHLVKIDEHSLAGGTVAPAAQRALVQSEAGLPHRVDFPVRCVAVAVRASAAGREAARAAPVQLPETALLSGNVARQALALDGQRVALPAARLSLVSAPLAAGGSLERPDLQPVPAAGYRDAGPQWQLAYALPPGVGVRGWRLSIFRLDQERPVLLRSLHGTGVPPPAVSWDGLDDGGRPAPSGALYTAQLHILGDAAGAEADSRHLPFGIGAVRPAGPRSELVHEPLFQGSGAAQRPSEPLAALLARVARELRPGDTVLLEVHTDPSVPRLAGIAQTQREAGLLAERLRQAGVPAGRIQARGRGGLEPLQAGNDPAARRRNRRVSVTVQPGQASATEVPVEVRPVAATPPVLVDGVAVPVQEDEFRHPLPRRSALVDLRAPDGRRAALLLAGEGGTAARPQQELPPRLGARTQVEVSGDLAAGTLRVAGAERSLAPLFGVDLRIAGQLPLGVAAAVLREEVAAPIEMQLSIPAGLPVHHARILCTDEAGRVVYQQPFQGTPPQRHQWNPTPAELPPGRYRCRLEIGSGRERVWSPERMLVVLSTRAVDSPGLVVQGRLFTGPRQLGTRLRDELSRFATRLLSRPAEERYTVVLRVAAGDTSVAAQRLAQAARQAALRAYLQRLGIAPARHDLHVDGAASDQDLLLVVPQPASHPAAVAVLINGSAVELREQRFVTQISAPPGGALVVDLTTGTGHRAALTLQAPGQPPATPAPAVGAPAPAPGPAAPPGPGQLHAWLPPAGTVLRSQQLAVSGEAGAGRELTINGRPVAVEPGGRFTALIELPSGVSELAIVTRGPGGAEQIRWPVRVDDEQAFWIGLAEGVAATSWARGLGSDRAFLAGMSERSALAVGPLLLHGRAAGHGRLRLRRRYGFSRIDISLALDTGREPGTAALFDEPLQAQRDLPVYGDASDEQFETSTRGPFSLRIVADDSRLVVGSSPIEVRGQHLFGYQRIIDGVELSLDRRVAAHRVEATAFAASAGDRATDSNLFRATGGTLYYLRRAFVVEGSERVRVLIRDRDTGLPLGERPLARNRDYTIDYQSGRLLLTAPVPAVAPSQWLLDSLGGTGAVLQGHPTYLEVRYEHDDPAGPDRGVAGVHGRGTVAGHLSLGAGVVTGARDEAEDYSLWGVDAALRASGGSELTAELAGSRQDDAPDLLSTDGGLRFLDLDRTAGDHGGGGSHWGWRLAARVLGRDLGSGRSGLHDSSLVAYVQSLDRGFSAPGRIGEQGRLKFGATLHHPVGAGALSLRHQGEVAELPLVGPTAADVAADPDPAQLEERASYTTQLQWRWQDGGWSSAVEAAHQRISSTAPLAGSAPALDADRVGAGLSTTWQVNRWWSARLAQQAIFGLADADPVLMPVVGRDDSSRRSDEPLRGVATSLGSELQLTGDTAVGLDWHQRWNGDSGVAASLRSAMFESGSLYVSQRLTREEGRGGFTTVLGAQEQRRGATDGRTYGEYQVDSGASGLRSRAVLGMGQRFALGRAARIGVGYEHQQALGAILADGSRVGDGQRDVVFAGIDLIGWRQFKLGSKLELRFDQGSDPPELETAAPAPYLDRGESSPGATLPPGAGDQLQLVGQLGALWKPLPDHTAFARLRASITRASDAAGDFTRARFAEASIGWIYRPLAHDWFHLLSRYAHLRERRPAPREEGGETRSHVLSLLPVAELPWRLTLAGKLALKRTALEQLAPGVGSSEATADALLGAVRLGRRWWRSWDAGIEYRQLWLDRAGVEERLAGVLVEVAHHLGPFARLGLGYNFSHFADDELADLERDAHGWFVRVTGHY